MRVNFDLIFGLKVGVTQDLNHMCWCILIFLESPGSFNSKKHLSIKVKVTQMCTFSRRSDGPSTLPRKKNVRFKHISNEVSNV